MLCARKCAWKWKKNSPNGRAQHVERSRKPDPSLSLRGSRTWFQRTSGGSLRAPRPQNCFHWETHLWKNQWSNEPYPCWLVTVCGVILPIIYWGFWSNPYGKPINQLWWGRCSQTMIGSQGIHASLQHGWSMRSRWGFWMCSEEHYLKHQESKMGVSKNGVYRDRLQNYHLRKEPLSTGFGNNDIMI